MSEDKKLKELLARLEKDFSKADISTLNEAPKLEVISSGIPGLDYAMGIGGYPRRLITEIYGPNSVGKSALSMMAIASAQKQGLICVLISTEGTPSKEWPEVFGVDTDRLIVAQTHTIEQVIARARTLSSDPDVGLIVIDSLGAVGSSREIEEDGKKQAFGISGQVATLMHILMPNCWTTNKACIILNQVRDVSNPKGYSIFESPGGHTLHHGASIRIQLKGGESKKERSHGEKKEIAKEVIAHIKKNKTDEPHRTTSWWLYHSEPEEPGPDYPGRGIDISHSLVSVGIALGVIEGSRKLSIPEVHFEQDAETGLGRENLARWLREDESRKDALYTLIKEKMSEQISDEDAKIYNKPGSNTGE
jgi:recombination protein RecA